MMRVVFYFIFGLIFWFSNYDLYENLVINYRYFFFKNYLYNVFEECNNVFLCSMEFV